MSEYDFELEKIIGHIKEKKAAKVGLQFPEGLKAHALEVAEEIRDKTAAEVFIFTDPVYGACDTKDGDAALLGLDMLVHFGHTEFL